jgi:hypothetical protein
MNASLRENIVFVSPFEQEKYEATVYAAGLLQDIAELPDGDRIVNPAS